MSQIFQETVDATISWLFNVLVQLPSKIISGLLVLFIFYVLARITAAIVMSAFFTAEHLNQVPAEAAKRSITRISFWGVMTIGIVAALSAAGVDLAGLMIGLGLVGFAVGFALKDIIANFLSGLLLILHHPFGIGDVIEVKGFSGTVEDIHIRSTRIKTFDGRRVIVPNNNVLNSVIVSNSAYTSRRVSVSGGTVKSENLETAMKVGLEAVRQIDGFIEEPAPQLLVKGFSDKGSVVEFRFWVDQSVIDPEIALSEAIQRINDAYDESALR